MELKDVFRPRWLAAAFGFRKYNSFFVASRRGWRPDKKKLNLLRQRVDKILKEAEEDESTRGRN